MRDQRFGLHVGVTCVEYHQLDRCPGCAQGSRERRGGHQLAMTLRTLKQQPAAPLLTMRDDRSEIPREIAGPLRGAHPPPPALP